MQLGEDKPFLELLPDVIKSYGMSMMYGSQHTSQSLPRMLTLWFEFGTFLTSFRSRAQVRPGSGVNGVGGMPACCAGGTRESALGGAQSLGRLPAAGARWRQPASPGLLHPPPPPPPPSA